MTFHPGGLNSEALHFWSWAAGSSSAGPTCPGDSQCAIQSLPSLTLPGPLPSPTHQQSSPSSQRDATSTGRLRGPFLPFLGDGSWRSGLARRKGVSETQPGAQWVCQTSNYQARNSASKPRGVPADFPSPGVLSRTSPVITASPFCPWTLLSRPGRCPSLGTTRHSVSLPAPPSPTLAFRVTPPTEF